MARIQGTNARNILRGTPSNDTISGLGGNDDLSGLVGNDKLDGGTGNDKLSGGLGNDRLLGGLGNDRIDGGAGNDTLDGGKGNDRMSGGLGNDTYVVDSALDTVIEGADPTPGAADTVRSSISYTLGANLENLALIGSAVSGTGNDLANVITGNARDNTLDGGAGTDTLDGGAGNDTLIGTAGVRDFLRGGDGNDWVSYEASSAINASLSAGFGEAAVGALASEEDFYTSIENVRGSQEADTITGNGSSNKLEGLGGSDVISGLQGDDTIDGGAGNDTLTGGADVDVVRGGDGDDTIDASELSAAFDSYDGGNGTDTVSYASALNSVTVNLATGLTGGDASFDAFFSIENLIGSAFGDTLTVKAGGSVTGGGGNDTLTVSGANGTADGGAGDDTIKVGPNGAAFGGADNDILEGDDFGQARETLNGGAGADTFKLHLGIELVDPISFAAADLIQDFNFILDKIQISRAEFGLSGLVLDASNVVSQAGSILGDAAKPQLIFEELTQTLYFDADGSGLGGPVAIAELPTLSVSLTFAMLDIVA